MKIHHRFLLFLLVSIAVYAVALHALRGGAERIGTMLLNVELREMAAHLNQILELERAPIEKGVYDNTFWDDMVDFVRRPDPEWARLNIGETFPNLGLQYVWVYDAAFQPVYAMPAPAGDADAIRPPPERLREAVGRNWFQHFFGLGPGDVPIEYFTAPIQPTADSERRTTPVGYLVAARRVDRDLTERLTAVSGSDVALQPSSAAAAPVNRADPSSGRMDVFVPLLDATGARIAALRARQANQGIQLLRDSLENYNVLYLVFAVANLALLAVFVFIWVKAPLQRISESLDRHDLTPVTRYLRARHEFGTLARLIRSFFQQREALVTELEMRKQYEAHLREARDLADRAAHVKSDFLALMSHELRTPLNAVIGLATLLLDEDPRPDQVDNLASLKLAAENLLVLINDVLDFNKLDAGKLVLDQREIDLRALCETIRQTFALQASAKGLSLSVSVMPDVPVRVVGDPLRVTQVLSNLISNAIKFTESGGVRVAAAAVGASAGHVRINFEVADTGIGIPAKDQAQIFELFTQGDSETTRRYGGTGLGLAIVSRLLELMDSKIEIDSAPGRGSTFRFVLEFARAPAEQPPADTADGGAALRGDVAGRRVLVVEDNAVNRELAVTFLRRWGCAVETADNGVAAIDKAMTRPYDLILMDLQMPQMGGIEATSRIRRNLRGPNARTLIIAFTATSPDDNVDLDAVGFDDVIAKPIDPDKLRRLLERSLAKLPPASQAG